MFEYVREQSGHEHGSRVLKIFDLHLSSALLDSGFGDGLVLVVGDIKCFSSSH